LKSLTENRAKGDYVFLKKDGSGVSRNYVIYRFLHALKKAKIEDFRFHDLRHTAAILYASGGCDIMSLKNLLGHQNIFMTQRYAYLMPKAHYRTRRIMNDFWKSSNGDTIKDTPEND
jgi:integrase